MAGRVQKVEPPALPQATNLYERPFQDQYSNVLRIFFNRLTASLNALLDPGAGGAALYLPYGSFYDTNDQFAVLTTAAYPVDITSTAYTSFVEVISNNQITVRKAGLYNIQFSIQFVNDTNAQKDVDVWFRKNGLDIPDSNSRFTVAARKSAGVYGHLIAALNFFVDMAADDYVQIMWRTEDIGVHLEQAAAGAAPTRPAVPSAIVTVNYVSAL